MLGGASNENGEKTTIGLISKNSSKFARVAHSFCTFLWPCFARLQCETSRNFLFTRVLEEMWYVFLFTLFFHCRSVSPWWPPAFLIFSPPLPNFMLFFQQKCFPCFFYLALALFLVELRWPVALLSLFLCLSFSLSSKSVDMTINLTLIL